MYRPESRFPDTGVTWTTPNRVRKMAGPLLNTFAPVWFLKKSSKFAQEASRTAPKALLGRISGVFPASGKRPDGPPGPGSNRWTNILHMSTGLKSWEVLWVWLQPRFPHAQNRHFHPFASSGRIPDTPPVVRGTGTKTPLRTCPNQTLRKAVRLDNKAGRGTLKTAVLAVFRGVSAVF